jgi:hypothetical protein
MADQCIVCLDTLDKVPDEIDAAKSNQLPEDSAALGADPSNGDNHEAIAAIHECGHVLHESCLRDWIEKANSCPICRQTFHLVEVFDKVGGMFPSSRGRPWLPRHITYTLPGNKLSSFAVEDKKQVAEFDAAAWIEDQVDDFDANPCPICDSADNEEVLLLCDSCDAPYHTYCAGLEEIPHGHWFCMECVSVGASNRAADTTRSVRPGRQPRTFAQRTQAQVRRGRRGGRTDGWHSAWDTLSERVWDALNIDLDYHDDQSLSQYRTHQRRTELERREFQQWQTRLNIASRQGARHVFSEAARPIFSAREAQPEMPKQTAEEKNAWDAFEKARGIDLDGSNSRKRKARSITKSPTEQPSQEPERKLKRPKTRRVIDKSGSSSDGQASSRQVPNTPAVPIPRVVAGPLPEVNAPSFLSSLLKEVEMSASTDDESTPQTHHATAASPSIDHSSPAVSPTTSNYSTPRALSTTPPPHAIRRPGSPLPLTSHIEPIFPRADYSPNRSPPDHYNSDGAGRSRPITPELRQPRPRRKQAALPRSEETSPTRANMSIETKKDISRIVRNALDPHYKKPSGITKEQYASINRAVSRMLYDKIADVETLEDENAKSAWERIASREVAKAVEGLLA